MRQIKIATKVPLVFELSFDHSMDYLIRVQEAANSFDTEGREEATRQFIDGETFKSSLRAYDKSKSAT